MLLDVAVVNPDEVKSIEIVEATLCERLVKPTTPPDAVKLVVPCSVPLPALREAVTAVVLSALRKLPNWSSIRTTGCCAKTTPAVAVKDGCVWMVNRCAAAGLTAIVLEVVLLKLPLEKTIVILVATLCDRFVKLITPPAALRLVVPCSVPLPAPRAALTTVLLSLLRRLPN